MAWGGSAYHLKPPDLWLIWKFPSLPCLFGRLPSSSHPEFWLSQLISPGSRFCPNPTYPLGPPLRHFTSGKLSPAWLAPHRTSLLPLSEWRHIQEPALRTYCPLNHGFLTRGNFAIWPSLVVPRAIGIYWIETKMLLSILECTGQLPTTKNYLAQMPIAGLASWASNRCSQHDLACRRAPCLV